MGLLIDLNNVNDPTKVGTGGRVKPGRCHAAMTKFDEYGEPKSGCHIANWEILAHDDPSQVGKVFKDFLGDPANVTSEKSAAYAVERILLYCYVLGVTTPEAMDAAKKGGEVPSLDLASANSRQAFLNLTEEEYNGKINTRISNAGFDIFGLNSPSAKDFPRNAAMTARAMQSASVSFAAGNASEMPTQAKQESADPFASNV